jgi:TonB family protein
LCVIFLTEDGFQKNKLKMTKQFKLLTLGLLLTISVKGQDLKKLTVGDKFYGTKEVFYVLKDNQEIRHGEYKRTSGKLKTIGQYDNNKRTGIWKSFGDNGELIQTIDFSNNKISPNNINISTDSKFWVKKDDSFSEVKPDQAPAFIGGYSALFRFIGTTLRYPADARRFGIQGKVFISVIITKDGRIIDETIEKGIGYGADEEALRVMQQIPDEWIPGMVNGEPTDIKIIIPITFRLG